MYPLSKPENGRLKRKKRILAKGPDKRMIISLIYEPVPLFFILKPVICPAGIDPSFLKNIIALICPSSCIPAIRIVSIAIYGVSKLKIIIIQKMKGRKQFDMYRRNFTIS